MKSRLTVVLAALVVVAVACNNDDPELSTDSTIITGGTNAPATTTTPSEGGDTSASPTSAPPVGETVSGYDVVAELPNDNGVEFHVVIPNGAYTDVDLENFIIDLLESNPDLYGAEVFDDPTAAEAFVVAEAERTEEQVSLLERHHFVSLIGREQIEFHGPFAEFPGGAIGS
jgi:hypothetical protein